MKKKDNDEWRDGLSVAASPVARLVGEAQVAQAEIEAKAAGRDGRGRPGNAGEKGRDKTGAAKATYALPVARQELIREIAEAEDVSQTDIVEAAAVLLSNLWRAGRVNFEGMKIPAKSLKVTWHLEVEDTFFLD